MNGNPVTVELEVKENPDYAESQKDLTFMDWLTHAPDTTAKNAWEYQQGKIQILLDEWNQSVLYGKDKLKESIESMTKLNNKLKGENQQLRKELAEYTQKGNNFV